MKRLNVFITVPQDTALRQMATQQGLSIAELIRRAIDAFLKQEQPPQRHTEG